MHVTPCTADVRMLKIQEVIIGILILSMWWPRMKRIHSVVLGTTATTIVGLGLEA